jgi:hypothetical protein
MGPNFDQERQEAHALLDMLTAEKLNAVRSLLEVMVEPLARALASAPMEEEEITHETAAALNRARGSLARGQASPTRKYSGSSGSSSERRRSARADRWSDHPNPVPSFALSIGTGRCRFSTALTGIWQAAPAT